MIPHYYASTEEKKVLGSFPFTQLRLARATNTHLWYSCQINTHRSWLAYTTGWMDVGQTNTAPDRINRSPSLFAQLKCNLLALELLHKGADGLTDRLDTTNSSFSLWDLQIDECNSNALSVYVSTTPSQPANAKSQQQRVTVNCSPVGKLNCCVWGAQVQCSAATVLVWTMEIGICAVVEQKYQSIASE